jgi:hypothetical protein
MISGVNALFWGTLVVLGLVFGQLSWQELKIPHKKAFFAGCWYAQNGLLVYGSDPHRTPQNLQPMLLQTLPWVVLFRAFHLQRYPVGGQRSGCILVIIGMVVAFVPSLLGADEESGSGAPSGTSAVLWSLFMVFTAFGGAATSVYAEEILESREVSTVYYLFWMEFWHFVLVLAVFWSDLLPGFGYADGWSDFIDKFSKGFALTFAGGEATYLTAIFLSFWALQTFGNCVLIRFNDGATWSSLMGAFALPLQILFLSLLSVDKSGVSLSPQINTKTIVNLLGAAITMPGLMVYDHATRQTEKSQKGAALAELSFSTRAEQSWP